ncbi:hypothetical protein ACFFUO_11560 [Vibrio artabrorum]
MRVWATVTMISLSLNATVTHASQCNHDNWQTLLERQLSTEKHYNQYTLEFNQALFRYQSQTLLSTHFTEKQIIKLWDKYKDRFNVQLNNHMNTAYLTAEVLLKRADAVSAKQEDAQSLKRAWQSLAKHCEVSRLFLQYQSALLHVQGSQSLVKDINTLSEKFRQLSLRYRNEATILDGVRQEKQPTQDVLN